MQTKNTITGFFNPRHAGDTYTGLGLAMGMDGTIADRVIPDLPSFLEAAGRNYYIKRVPAGVLDPNGAVAEDGSVVPSWIEVEGQYHLVRSSDHRVVSPHTVSEQYAPLSLVDMADELQPWCDAGWATPDGVYSSKRESLEILSMRLDAGGDLPDGEKFLHYVIFQNPHGAGGTAKGKIISWRIVCANTFAAAVSASSDFTISHRVAAGDHEAQRAIMVERSQQAVAAWSKVQDHIAGLADRINNWQSVPVSSTQAENLTDRLLGIAKLENASPQKKNRRAAILSGFNMPSMGTNGKTAWDWLNGVTYVNSSPNAEANKKSKVSAVERAVRVTDTNGTGFKLEQQAEKVLANFTS